jgi:hypothetical protein
MTGQDPVFRLAYDGTFADYRALLRARERLGWLRGHGRWLRYPFVIGLFMATLWWLGALSGSRSAVATIDIVQWVFALVVFVALVDIVFEHGIGRWVYSRYAAADRPVAVSVDAEGVSWNVDAWSGRFAWSAVRNSVVTDDCLFIFIGKLEAITLPRRGLAGGDWDGLLAFVTERLPAPPVRG